MYNEIEGTNLNQGKARGTGRSKTHEVHKDPIPTESERQRTINNARERRSNRRVMVGATLLGVTALALVAGSVFAGVSAGRNAAASRMKEYHERNAVMQDANQHNNHQYQRDVRGQRMNQQTRHGYGYDAGVYGNYGYNKNHMTQQAGWYGDYVREYMDFLSGDVTSQQPKTKQALISRVALHGNVPTQGTDAGQSESGSAPNARVTSR